MKIAYQEWNPKPETLDLVYAAEEIIEEYQEAGYVLTLRQLYYQFVARDLIENTERSYKNLGNTITKARMAGLISWEAIEDRNREHRDFWTDEEILNPIMALPEYIRYDRWARQDYYVEVWVEKEALGNVVARACEPFMVPHMSCKGYLSASEAWRAGRRLADRVWNDDKQCVVIHLGDHDPSGIDMTRDNRDRLDLFAGFEAQPDIEVVRIALNMDQVEAYDPPPNPAKVTDSRAKSYIRRFGRTSWELDALEPRVLHSLIQNTIKEYIDPERWEAVAEQEAEQRDVLRGVYENWDAIKELIS